MKAAVGLIALAVSVVFVVWFLAFMMNRYSVDEVRAVCRAHQGVVQVVESGTVFSSSEYAAVVVCRDGLVGVVD